MLPLPHRGLTLWSHAKPRYSAPARLRVAKSRTRRAHTAHAPTVRTQRHRHSALVSDCRGGGGEDAAAADVCEATAHADRYGLTARAPAKAFGGAVLGWGEGASFRRPFFGLPTELAMEQTP